MLDGGRLNPTQTDTARTYSPAIVAGQALATQLGVPTTAVTLTNTPTPAGARQLGVVHSPTVPDLVTTMLQISDNVLAEVMGRTVAIADNQPPTFTGGTTAVLDVLRRNGFDTTGMSLSDSSGLSPSDRLQPRLLAQILRVAASADTSDPRVAKLRPLLLGLPIAGSPVGDGTLAGRYQTGTSSAGKGWVRAKTGTLTDQGVFALAGVVLDTDGRVLVFALVSNQAPSGLAPSVLDTMAATLRGCGCR
jgi:D-alanyl-D-alanine carboxypeptidase/D-alanyl-D-alanine-endopeptidase (penicillin-binding protein 4)